MLFSVFYQEWPRQAKPKTGQFMNFSQGHSATKVQCESYLFFLRKNTRIHKRRAKIHELFVLALSLVWFAGATPDFSGENTLKIPSGKPPGKGLPKLMSQDTVPNHLHPKAGLAYRGRVPDASPYYKPKFL